ncbi:general stress protein [Brachybacterium sp. sponge]|uniref:general stress protein n=1 Tax=Brachybacterium sp. sponge TaxID=1775432 RepID=UPI0007A474CB|nr:general stress protein [Brachybacterium sp. sponge]
MSQSPYARQSPSASSPLTARLYDLEYPRSLGVYSTYQEVQSVVDTLADHEFPVQSTLIVGTDLKLMERVTGRRTWPKVIGQGILSGLWMGLFLGLLFMLITPGDLMIVLSSVLMGIVFFTVWSVIGYAMTGGKRDFTSMTSTIPMQYELLVEHKHADQARRILAESGAGPAVAPSPAAAPQASGRFGSPAPTQGGGQYGAPAPTADSGQYTAPSPTQGSGQYGSPAGQSGLGYGAPGPQRAGSSAQGQAGQQGVGPQHGAGQQQGFGAAPAPGSSADRAGAPSRPHRPSFGQPAGTPQREDAQAGGGQDGTGTGDHRNPGTAQQDGAAHQDGTAPRDGTTPER